MVDIARDQRNYVPESLAGFLAEIIARISSSYFQAEEELISDAYKAFSSARTDLLGHDDYKRALYHDEIFVDRYPYGPADELNAKNIRRRPTPIEAAIETARRQRDLRRLLDVLKPTQLCNGIILGGSLSYGRFFNVLGARYDKASDIDLMIVLDEYSQLTDLGDALRSISFVSPASIDLFLNRANEFNSDQVASMQEFVVFSAKLTCWKEIGDTTLDGLGVSSEYSISLHIVTDRVFDEIVFRNVAKISLDTVGRGHSIYDFRETSPTREDYQRSFSGQSATLALDSEQIGESFLRATRAFHIDGETDSLYPGMFQNTILPAFDLQPQSSLDLRRKVDAFRWKMVDRLRYEKNKRPDEHLRLGLCHTRSEVFSPHMIRAIDASTLLA
ncbi:hypothetical protein C1S80_19760 [Mycolicibacterium aubagnense]|nr:hypothetical protein C1S80_19760 [Mycolicibacterium aubagnense]